MGTGGARSRAPRASAPPPLKLTRALVLTPTPHNLYLSLSDVEGIFTLMLSLLGSVGPAEHDAVIEAIVAALAASPEKALLRLRM